MTELRKILRIVGDSKEQVRLSELRIGDIFAVYEDDKLIGIATATGEPYEKDGVWGIGCKLWKSWKSNE